MDLFVEGSPEDLACRGFGREAILARTGVDPGYHTNSLSSVTRGIDRKAYRVEHVRQRVADDVIENALSDYADCKLDAEGVLSRLGLSNPHVCTLRKLFGLLRMTDRFKHADNAHRRGHMARGMVESYGVDNPFKLDEFQEKAAETRDERYGARYTLASGSSLSDGARDSFREHMKDDSFREEVAAKKRATCMEHFGVEHQMSSAEVREKIRRTCLERYGAESWAQTEEARKAQSDRAREHGAEWARRARATCLERYGVESWSQTDEARAAQSVRMRESLDERFEKMHETMLERYGVEWGGQTERHRELMRLWWSENKAEIVAKIRETTLQRYGVPFYSQTYEARKAQSERMRHDAYRRAEVARETMRERYGVDHWIRIPENAAVAVEAARATMRERYGVDYWMQIPEHARSVHEAIVANGSYGVSDAEGFVLGLLIERFGEDDIEVQYLSDERYPFRCDFYVRSRDLFIEVNGTWTHGGHWFDADNVDDRKVAELWLDKGGDYYKTAFECWTVRDVRKRAFARESKLNYVVFWDGSPDAMDARLWFAMGCPDGSDWDRAYSWLPERDVHVEVTWPDELSARPGIVRRVAQAANGACLWSREVAVWSDNPYRPKWGTLQANLYANRLKYMRSGTDGHGLWEGPSPCELTDMQIVRGLGISGMVRSYSVFDNAAMVEFLDDFGIRKVYDPCAGWGERLVTCAAKSVSYVGCDVRAEIVSGYERIIDRYGLSDVHAVCADAAVNDMRMCDHDAVFTCPPYGSVEIYSDKGAENLGDAAFADWWRTVCAMSVGTDTRWFAVQTNQAMRKVFAEGIEGAGFDFVREIVLSSGKRPYNRTRKEYECVLVFGRCR